MHEFRITIVIPGLTEAINSLAAVLGQPHNVCNQHGENNHHVENTGVVNIDTSVTAEAPVAPVQTTAVPTAPDDARASRAITFDDITAAGSQLLDEGRMNDLMDLLKGFGVQAVTQLKPEQYDAVAISLRTLGAKI